jgi:hypothetical protein
VTPVQIAVEVVGWTGALLILLAYVLVTVGRLTGQSLAFQWMNLLGAAGFIVNGWWHGALPSTALNVVWMLIAAVALWRLWRTRGSSTSAM